MASYIALLRKDPDSDFSVDFPDFPGCITAGDTLEQARQRAAEALAFHIDSMREDGESIPAPSSADVVMADPDNRDGIAFLIDVPEPARLIRVNVTLEESLLDAIKGRTTNRSRFLAEAAREKLARESA
ncbi:type II toxin-antitoxin system HicB family antitoxin [Gluconacetobacter azotocaptans]|uniref:type II toxin-antitoxin system HicB family antitoxin n=1 Tax=Gluconacetobacter azotocaptans TaxID=142834 RepID=UPI00195C5D93|nr:type II toxin-antitoxin system HicB family antitoxin [Gluconacetobacter azotocaptans]MBM9401546.1 type II toxin-antitoxin system HicB family antitoxin [Gluconacetobacter azotocaptans]